MIARQEQYWLAEIREPRNVMYWKDFSRSPGVPDLVATVPGANYINRWR